MRRNHAFTLIELLVVIAIIAILAAILFPVFAQAKVAAKGAATVSNQKQLMLAFLMYSNDHDDVTVLHETPGNPNGSSNPPMYILQRLYPYMKNLDLPWDASTGKPELDPSFTDKDGTGYWGDWTTYHNLSVNGAGLLGYWTWPNNVATFNYTRVLSAQEDIAKRAAFINTGWPGYGDPWGWYQFLNWSAITPNYSDPNDFWANQTYIARTRYSNKNVVGYADGHAGKAGINIYIPNGVGYWDGYVGDRKAFWGAYWSSTE
jgi:prepilin-type N-terminal cleavage/methylation domain-containing protein